MYLPIPCNALGSIFVFSFHIMFAMLDVLKVDFPDLYNRVAPLDFYPLLHYPFYR